MSDNAVLGVPRMRFERVALGPFPLVDMPGARRHRISNDAPGIKLPHHSQTMT